MTRDWKRGFLSGLVAGGAGAFAAVAISDRAWWLLGFALSWAVVTEMLGRLMIGPPGQH